MDLICKLLSFSLDEMAENLPSVSSLLRYFRRYETLLKMSENLSSISGLLKRTLYVI